MLLSFTLNKYHHERSFHPCSQQKNALGSACILKIISSQSEIYHSDLADLNEKCLLYESFRAGSSANRPSVADEFPNFMEVIWEVCRQDCNVHHIYFFTYMMYTVACVCMNHS